MKSNLLKSSTLPLRSFRLQNFKAVRDSKTIKFTPITVFIGNNGSGKSSIVEGLESFQHIIMEGVDEAMAPWHGYENIWNQVQRFAAPRKNGNIPGKMEFLVEGFSFTEHHRHHLAVAPKAENLNEINITDYSAGFGKQPLTPVPLRIKPGRVLDDRLSRYITNWQFIHLEPRSMTEPILQNRASGEILLKRDGSNIAEFLLSIFNSETDHQTYHAIIEALKVVLPYADDLETRITSELERKVYLTLIEKGVTTKLPGWLLSTGTMRILALLAVLRHPKPPSVIVIEELENGLDPRTLQLLVEEFRIFIQTGKGQIIITTHSPYLLDLFHLSQIIVVERDENGSPQFVRPGSHTALDSWSKEFSPGRLYTMGALTRK
ncbi:MAG: AAA family ATPase [Chitinispirillaceae bacterium]|nr:AAA family ATPase [Chitinispirillaceae bacterium]